MDLILGEKVVLGVCVNLSESGLRGTFSLPVPAGTEGPLTLYWEERSFQVRVRIESFTGEEARATFQFSSEQERENIQELLKLLTPPPFRRS